MFKKSRRSIVASLVSVLVLLWAGTLGIIYTSSYIELSKRNRRMLKTHSEMFLLRHQLNKPGFGKPIPDKRPGNANSPAFKLTTFYTVAIDYDGQVLETNNEQPLVHSNEKLEALAYEAAAKKNTFGTKDNLVFFTADKGGISACFLYG